MSLNNPLSLPPAPYQQPMCNPQTGLITPEWQKWFQILQVRVGGAVAVPPANLNSLPLVNLIATTAPSIAAALYTVPIGQKLVINQLQVQNVDLTARTFNVWLVGAGETAGASNIAINTQAVAAGSTFSGSVLQYKVLNGGGMIFIQGSAAGVLQVTADGRLSS